MGMLFRPDNPINQLCAAGTLLEGSQPAAALALYEEAWRKAADALELMTAAHYLARLQSSIADKLRWDEIALAEALKIEGDEIKGTYPSLYLNVAKCCEDLNETDKARGYYVAALGFTCHLPQDGYGSMIKAGIEKGLQRVGQ